MFVYKLNVKDLYNIYSCKYIMILNSIDCLYKWIFKYL